MKYVMMEAQVGGVLRRFPIIFPNALIHVEVATAIKVLMEEQWKGVVPKPVSAGEIQVRCTIPEDPLNRSATLDLSWAPGDEPLINGLDYNHGIV